MIYPNIYQPNYYQQPQQRNESSLIWVQGEAAAKSYLVSPGTSALLMDSEKNVFYIKSADASGMPLPLRIFDYTERTVQTTMAPAATQSVEYVTKEEFEQRISELMAATATKPTRKGQKEENE